jgi:hypothetical protein
MSLALLDGQIEDPGWHADGTESDVQAHNHSGQVKLGVSQAPSASVMKY